jgi:hypothetical protein
MTWTKRDYEFFAQVLNNTQMSVQERVYLSSRFGDIFAADNSNFDWERWNAAIFEWKITQRGGTAKYGGWTAKTYKMTADALSGPGRQNQYALTITLSEDTRLALISAFGAAFERDNQRFNWDKFRIAAGSPYALGEIGSWEPKGYRRSDVRVRGHSRRGK